MPGESRPALQVAGLSFSLLTSYFSLGMRDEALHGDW